MAENVVGHPTIIIKEEREDYREYILPHGWRKVGKKRPIPSKTGGEIWDFSVFSPDGKKFRSSTEIAKFLDSNPEIKCDREVTNTSQCWSQKTPGKKTGILKETKLKSSPAQKTPKIFENEDPKIFKKKENAPKEFQSPKIKSSPAQKNTPAKKNGILKELKLEFSPEKRKEYLQGSLKKMEKPGPLSKKRKISEEEQNHYHFNYSRKSVSEEVQKPKPGPLSKKRKIFENEDPKIFKKKEDVPEEFQSPKLRRISNKEILKIIQFLDNDPKLQFLDEE